MTESCDTISENILKIDTDMDHGTNSDNIDLSKNRS